MPARPRPLMRAAQGLPWQGRTALGVLTAALGCYLVTRPLSSLTVLALCVGATFVVLAVGEVTKDDRTVLDLLAGVAGGVIGVLVLLVPGHLISALPYVLGGYLLAVGVAKVPRLRTGSVDERASTALLALTQVILGILALTWHDVSLVVAAALFGVALVVSGLSLAVRALVSRDRDPLNGDEPRTRGWVWRWARVSAYGLALLVSIGLLALGAGLRHGSPRVDDFYAAPADLPTTPGRLIRSEPFTTDVPAAAQAWRILYTTTDALGRATYASGIVLVPRASTTAPHPVIAWAHGTTGYARQCAPSLLAHPFTSGAFPDVMRQVIARGWAVVATDYPGLGTPGPQPYIIGLGEGRSVLDSVRAARQLTAARLSEETIVWGHSQGGGAALWADEVQPRYAPDVPLRGTVAMAPAAVPLALARNLQHVPGGSVFGSFVALAYAQTYPDVHLADFLRPAAIPFVHQLASRCLSEPGVLASVLTALSLRNENILSTDPGNGALGRRLAANVPADPGPGPLLIAQGLSDSLVVPSVTQGYVAQLRKDGHRVSFKTYPGLNHMPLVQAGSALLPTLMAWTSAHFAEGG